MVRWKRRTCWRSCRRSADAPPPSSVFRKANEFAIKKVLDLGADGVIVPQVNTAEQAADVVRFSRYAPQGARGVGLARAHGYGLSFQDYMDSANERVSVVVQAEHAQSVENIEEIVKVPGVDAVLLGPYDLSASLGQTGNLDHPSVVAAIDRIITVCQSAGVPVGYFGVTADAVKPFIERGCSLIVASVDTLLLGVTAKADAGGTEITPDGADRLGFMKSL